jgi:hypothetical protein
VTQALGRQSGAPKTESGRANTTSRTKPYHSSFSFGVALPAGALAAAVSRLARRRLFWKKLAPLTALVDSRLLRLEKPARQVKKHSLHLGQSKKHEGSSAH